MANDKNCADPTQSYIWNVKEVFFLLEKFGGESI